MSINDSTPIMVDQQLSEAGTYINNAAGQIAEELQRLRTQLQPLADTWTGPAASYFDPLLEEWNFAAIGLFGTAAQDGVLGEIASAMNVAWGNYADAEWANANTWKATG